MSSPKINIPNPCPMSLNRVKSGDTFFCNSCDKKIIDFRDKSAEEIITYFKTGTSCGIYYSHQVTTSNYSFKNKFLYKVLTVLAVLGLNVKPLGAQTKKELLNDSATTARRTVNLEKTPETKTEEKEEAKKECVTPVEEKKSGRRKRKDKKPEEHLIIMGDSFYY
jgi:hypothetical protein